MPNIYGAATNSSRTSKPRTTRVGCRPELRVSWQADNGQWYISLTSEVGQDRGSDHWQSPHFAVRCV